MADLVDKSLTKRIVRGSSKQSWMPTSDHHLLVSQSIDEGGGAEPNLVTETGARRIEGEVASLKDRLLPATDGPDSLSLTKELRYWEARRSSMEIVPTPKIATKVGFGVTISIERDGSPEELSIVGEDEADPKVDSIAWTSDLAKAISDKAPGDMITIKLVGEGKRS